MPPSLRTSRAFAGPIRALVGPFAMVLAAAMLFSAAAYLTLHFKHIGERGVRAQRDLQGVLTEFQTQDALEWRAISGRVLLSDIHQAMDQSRSRGAALIVSAQREGLPTEAAEKIIARHRAYTDAVDTELDLLAQGHPVEAAIHDNIDVDPAFTAARAVLTEYSDQLAVTARRAGRLSDLGILLTVALTMILTGAGYGRRRTAEARQKQVRHSEARYRALVDQSADIVIVTDRLGNPAYLSPSAERLFQRPGGRVPEGSDLAAAVHPEDSAGLIEALATVGRRDAALIELRVATGLPEPTWRHFEVSLQDLTADPAVRGIVLTGHDVTDRRALQREVEHRALHDNLTGLPNRALLHDRLSQALQVGHRHGTPTGLLLIDLDRFKEINDTLGHHYGDQLLAQVGPRLGEGLRQMDTVARLGGDEFAVLLPTVRDLHGATEVAHKLQNALSRPFLVDGVQLDIEASIGVVISGAHGDDASTLIQRADVAMYAAKRRNLGVSSYDREVDSNSPERLALLGDLRRALSEHELFLHYQPKIDLRSGRLCGAEALLRWQHPERGLIPPDDFIPLAENTGLIGPLTSYVLDLALAQVRIWADQGHRLQVAVNLSARNLMAEDLDQIVCDLLIDHGVSPDLLKLEVTESAIMTDPTRATGVLQRLAAVGIDISIDDFGAGYTSIRQLKDLPISELKVDRSFVTDMETDANNAVIVRSIVDLGHNLGLSIVAEGVETQAGLDRLRAYGCDVAQGYFLSRPVAPSDFEAWRDSWPGLPAAGPGRPELLPGPREPAVQP